MIFPAMKIILEMILNININFEDLTATRSKKKSSWLNNNISSESKSKLSEYFIVSNIRQWYHSWLRKKFISLMLEENQ